MRLPRLNENAPNSNLAPHQPRLIPPRGSVDAECNHNGVWEHRLYASCIRRRAAFCIKAPRVHPTLEYRSRLICRVPTFVLCNSILSPARAILLYDLVKQNFFYLVFGCAVKKFLHSETEGVDCHFSHLGARLGAGAPGGKQTFVSNQSEKLHFARGPRWRSGNRNERRVMNWLLARASRKITSFGRGTERAGEWCDPSLHT